MLVEYFDQLLSAACQVHVVYLAQLLGAVLFIHFISNHDIVLGMNSRLTDFFQTKSSRELEVILEGTFQRKNLCQVIQFRRDQLTESSKSKLSDIVSNCFDKNRREKVIVAEAREWIDKLGLSDEDALNVVSEIVFK